MSLVLSKNALTIKLADRLSNIMDNPKESYITDTFELMTHLLENLWLTGVQINLVLTIIQEITLIQK